MNPVYKIALVCLLLTGLVFAQNDPLGGRDSLVLENERLQDVIDSEKPFYKAAYQNISTGKDEQLSYSSQSFYVETDFEPEPPQIRPIEIEDQVPLHQNYLRLGIGRFTTPFGQLYINNGRDRELDYGFHYNHESAYNDVIELRRFRRDQAKLEGTYLLNNIGLKGNIGFFNTNYFNYAGDTLIDVGPDSLANRQQLVEDSLRMSFTRFQVAGGLYSPEDLNTDYRYEILGRARIYNDRRRNREFQYSLLPQGSFEIADNFEVKLNSELSVIQSRIDTGNQNRFFLDVAPTLHFANEQIQLKGGIKYDFFRNSIDSSGVGLLVPLVEVRYAINPGSFAIMVGYDGGMQHHTYMDMIATNPYLQTSAIVRPTRQQMNLYAGVEGRVGSRINFAGRAYYQRNFDQLIYRSVDSIFFEPVYDSLTTVFGTFAEANVKVFDFLDMGAAFNFNIYNTTNQDSLTPKFFHAVPLRLDVYAVYKALDDRFTAKGEFSLYGPTPMAEVTFTGVGGETVTEVDNRGSFVGLNLSADYRITDGFSVFLRGNNLLGVNYARWFNYPERRFDVQGGVAFAF
ncbi:MAG: TonB-dependent receptor [Bacteroidota bacterium]